VTGLPGGLGSADLSILGLIFALVTRNTTIAGAATLLIRFCTLWFGVSLGAIGLLIFRRSLAGPPKSGTSNQGTASEALAAAD
jgi:uncharacterized membrane protein YbhN (UPF0104 family)